MWKIFVPFELPWLVIAYTKYLFFKYLFHILYGYVLAIYFYSLVVSTWRSFGWIWKKRTIVDYFNGSWHYGNVNFFYCYLNGDGKHKCIYDYDDWIQLVSDNIMKMEDMICCSENFALNCLFVAVCRANWWIIDEGWCLFVG